MSIDLRLLAIADPAVLGERDLVSSARAAQTGGATVLQLRMKQVPAAELYRLAVELRSTLSIPVFVNDRADVALAAGAQGVHLGQDDLPAALLGVLSSPGFRIGVSVGSAAEAQLALSATVDYWSVGPLYRSASKADAGVPLGLSGFAELAALAPTGMPVIAIGGITAANAGDVIRAGAAGVAVISAIFAAGDIKQATRLMRDAVDQAVSGEQ